MNSYDLISFDMDGTLLNSEQKISQHTKEAIDMAVNAGKTVIISTGRSPSELRDYNYEFENIRYYICENGALLFDSFENRIIYSKSIPPEMMEKILEAAEQADAMIYIASNGQNMSTYSDVLRMDHFHVGQYKELTLKTAVLHQDIIASYRQKPFPVEKLNFSCASTEVREFLYKILRPLPLTIAYSETASLELSPQNVSKELGLKKLCAYLSIPMERTIAVGDSDNDIKILNAAGLSIAMGNALPHIKAQCKVVVADNNHDGCAEAIEKYLLGNA